MRNAILGNDLKLPTSQPSKEARRKRIVPCEECCLQKTSRLHEPPKVLWVVITAKIKFGIFIMPFADAVFNIFTGVWCYELYLMCSQWCSPKRRCSFVVSVYVTNYVCVVLYGIMLNLEAIISVCMVLCETSMLLFVFRIGHFRVPLSLCFKASLSAKLFSWKWHWFAWNWNCMPNWFSFERFRT